MDEETLSSEKNIKASSSSESSLNPPDYILRNLTPLRTMKQKDKSRTKFKEEILESRRTKLRERSFQIQKKLEALKRRENSKTKQLAENLKEGLYLAEERRRRFLETRRSRAKQFNSQMLLDLMNSDTGDLDNNVFSEMTSLQAKHSLSLTGAHRTVKLAIDRYMLLKYSTRIRHMSFLFTFESWPFRKCIKAISQDSEFYTCMKKMMQAMALPDIMSSQDYRSFFYSFVLISDFMEPMKHLDHPGFNSNTGIKIKDFLQNILTILLFKLACDLIQKFRCLVLGDFLALLDPWSSSRLSLRKSWNIYHFLFTIFRRAHLENCISIIRNAAIISSSHNRIVNYSDCQLIKYEKNFKDHLTFLQKISKRIRIVDDWTAFGITSEDLLRDATEVSKSYLNSNPPHIKADISLIKELNDPACSDPRIHESIICIGRYRFEIIPLIDLNNWRQYWIHKYLTLTDENLSYPSQMKSGLFSLTPKQPTSTFCPDFPCDFPLHYIERKYESLLGETQISEALKHMNDLSMILFHAVYNTCRRFDSSDLAIELCEVLADFLKLQKTYDSYEKVSKKMVLQYFKLQFLCYKQLLLLAEIKVFSLFLDQCNLVIDLAESVKEPDFKFIEEVGHFFQGLEFSMTTHWLYKCKLRSRKEIQIFENICQYVSLKGFSVEQGVHSPQLRFPRFYKTFLQGNYAYEESIFNYKLIFCANLLYPAILEPNPCSNSKQYFICVITKVLFRSNDVFKGDYLKACETEFTHYFAEDIKGHVLASRNLLFTNFIFLIVGSFMKSLCLYQDQQKTIPVLQTHLKQLAREFMETLKDELKEPAELVYQRISALMLHRGIKFQNAREENSFNTYFVQMYNAFFEQDCPSLRTLILEKFFLLLCSDKDSIQFNKLLGGNFFYCYSQTYNTIVRIQDMIGSIYDLYSPLLDWIYGDIGEPLVPTMTLLGCQ